MPDTEKVAMTWVQKMTAFISNHPNGYAEDDILWLIKAWMEVGKNWPNTGDTATEGAKYETAVRSWILTGNLVTEFTKMPPNPDPKDTSKPSLRLLHSLQDLQSQAHRMRSTEYIAAFKKAEANMIAVLVAFRIGLAEDNIDRAGKFLYRIGELRHHLKKPA